jgi:hypothetical protein
MSIYATLWVLRFPAEGDYQSGCDWIEVMAQSVPSHIGTPTAGHGYEAGDPYAPFLPAPIPVDENSNAPFPRAVVFVTSGSLKGTERSGQEYLSPLLVLTGKEYVEIAFDDLHSRICSRLRGNRAPIVAELFRPNHPPKTIRSR